MIISSELSADGRAFHYLHAGDPDAPLLLFLHGFPEYSGAWEDLLARLSDAFFCVAPDQRGYGRSAKPEGVDAYRARHLAQDAAAILTRFAPRARAVVGHDWGAAVAYELSFTQPELMEKLIIMNGAHPIPFQRALATGGAQSRASQYFHYLRDGRAEARLSADNFLKLRTLFAEGMNMDWLSGARLERYVDAWSQPGALTGMLNWYRATPLQVAAPGEPIPLEPLTEEKAKRFRVRPPHLLIWGAGDTALLPEATEGLEAFCDDLTRVEIADADHWIAHQKPDEVARLIRDFVS